MCTILFFFDVALAFLSLCPSLLVLVDCFQGLCLETMGGWQEQRTHAQKKKLWVHRSVLGSIASDQEENRVHKEPKHIDLGLRHVQFGVSLTPKMSPWSKDLSQTQLTETWNG